MRAYGDVWQLIGIECLRGDTPLPDEDQRAYLHLWRLLGHLLGLRDEYNPCRRDVPYAKAFLESIVMHLLDPDPLSVRVAHHLLRAPASRTGRGNEERFFIRNASVTRLLIGDSLGDALELPFDVAARCRARRLLWAFRFYACLCDSWLFGRALTWLHRGVMRAVQLGEGSAEFAMTCPARS